MKKLRDYINNNILLKIASLNSVKVITKILTGFITSKVIAIFLGAEGFALIGNLRDFLTSIQSFSSLGLQSGFVKYIAEFKKNIKELNKIISTVFFLVFGATILVSFGCYFNADYINNIIFPTEQRYTYVIQILAIALPFYTLNMFVFSILNGFSKFKTLLIINIIGQVFGAALTVFLIYINQIDGALISVVIGESLMFLITLIGVAKHRYLVSFIKIKHLNYNYIKKLSTFSFMALFSALVLPIVSVYIRLYIIDTIGLKEAGFWDAITRISKYYLMFVSSLLALYILPRFSEIDTVKDFRKEVFNFYKTIIPIFAVVLIIIYLLRSFIVSLIFTNEFKPVEDLFLWQLLGDFIKVLSLVISYQFLSKKMFWHYITTEAFSVTILYLGSIYFIDLYGVKGTVIAHFVTYICYYSVILLIFRSSLFGKLPKKEDR